jgi:hypothetical protein
MSSRDRPILRPRRAASGLFAAERHFDALFALLDRTI